MSCCPSGENRIAETAAVCPCNAFKHCPEYIPYSNLLIITATGNLGLGGVKGDRKNFPLVSLPGL
jgi:hypothetical protein